QSDANTANKETPLELIQQGDQIIVRTNQDRVSDRIRVTSDLELTVPMGSSIEAHGRQGDFDIQNVNGAVDISSDNAGVRLQNIDGQVNVGGTYVGQVQLRNLAQPLWYEDPLITVSLEKLPGQIHMGLGEFTGNTLVGPIRLNARSRDVQMSDFTQSLDLTL